jgi:hypothetical protein
LDFDRLSDPRASHGFFRCFSRVFRNRNRNLAAFAADAFCQLERPCPSLSPRSEGNDLLHGHNAGVDELLDRRVAGPRVSGSGLQREHLGIRERMAMSIHAVVTPCCLDSNLAPRFVLARPQTEVVEYPRDHAIAIPLVVLAQEDPRLLQGHGCRLSPTQLPIVPHDLPRTTTPRVCAGVERVVQHAGDEGRAGNGGLSSSTNCTV